MRSTDVTLILASSAGEGDFRAASEGLAVCLDRSGFRVEIVEAHRDDERRWGDTIRSVWAAATGKAIVIVDARRCPVSAVVDAVALIQSGSADLLLGARYTRDAPALLRWLLVPVLPDPGVELMALTAEAARLLIGESQLGRDVQLEIAYLANKYGFRVERLHLPGAASESRWSTNRLWGQLLAAFTIRRIDRRNGYRPPRRCPICFSTEVWSCAQIQGEVVRACRRCKCRYRTHLRDDEKGALEAGALRSTSPEREWGEESTPARIARKKTSERRLSQLRKHLSARSRVLEIGVRDGSFGMAASHDLEYVGIDRTSAVARSARSRGLEVYCSALGNFVNTGPAFDAVTLHHVFESLTDPHEALLRIKELLKPGGILQLTTFDTESLLFLLTEKRWMAQSFRTRMVLYSRSALIELLEHSGFEVITVGPELEYRDHRFLRYVASSQKPPIAALVRWLIRFLPDPMVIGSGSIRIVAKRRSGSPYDFRPIRSIEPTHAR